MARHARAIIVFFAIAGCASESAERYWAGVMEKWSKEPQPYQDVSASWNPHQRDPSREAPQQSRCDDD